MSNIKNLIKVVFSGEKGMNLITFGQIEKDNHSLDDKSITNFVRFSFSMLHSLYDVNKKRFVWSPAWYVIKDKTAYRMFNLIAEVTRVLGKSRECDWADIGYMLERPPYNLYQAKARMLAITLNRGELRYSLEELIVCIPEDQVERVVSEPQQFLALQTARIFDNRLSHPVIIPYSWKGVPAEPFNILAVSILVVSTWGRLDNSCRGLKGFKVSTITQRAKKIRKKLGLTGDRGDYKSVLEDLIASNVFEDNKCGVDLASQRFIRMRSETEILHSAGYNASYTSIPGTRSVYRKPLPKNVVELTSDIKDSFAIIV